LDVRGPGGGRNGRQFVILVVALRERDAVAVARGIERPERLITDTGSSGSEWEPSQRAHLPGVMRGSGLGSRRKGCGTAPGRRFDLLPESFASHCPATIGGRTGRFRL